MNALFKIDQPEQGLRHRALLGGAYSMSGEISTFVLRVGSMIILARLLMPEDFGLIGMVMVLTSIADRFKDLGLSIATIQAKKITQEQLSSLFWINTGLGVAFMVAVAALANGIAWFYKDERLVMIGLALSSTFFFGGLTVQHQAILRRRMRFGRLSLINIVSDLLSILLSIILAWSGFKYWALAFKEIFRSILLAVGTLIMCPWLPNLTIRSENLGPILRFGRNITGFNLIFFLARSLDQVLIGKMSGAIALGYYRQAYNLMSLPLGKLQSVTNQISEPALSKLQNYDERYRQSYLRILSLLSFVTMPLVIFLIVFSEPVVHITLGKKWLMSFPILRILLIGAFIQPLVSTCGFAMVTYGKSLQYFKWGFLNAISFVIAVSVGIKWGSTGVALGVTVNTYFMLLPSVWYGLYGTPISLKLFFGTLLKPMIASLVMGIVLIILYTIFKETNNLLTIFFSLLIGPVSYLLIWLILPGGKSQLKEYFSYLKDSIKKLERGHN